MTSPPSLALAIAHHVPAFETPGRETRDAKRLRKRLAQSPLRSATTVSVSVDDSELFAFLQYLASDAGRRAYPLHWRQLVAWLYAVATQLPIQSVRPRATDDGEWTTRRVGVYDLLTPSLATGSPCALAMLALRPSPLLPLSLSSARRAVTFVHSFIALVTANAYISTLGGGHFLCLHLTEAKCMARLQIAIADALYDPVLKSKCRVNLAYNAMREGRFGRARRLLHDEEAVAQTLANDELEKICAAAHVYLTKTIKLHREFQRQRADLTTRERTVVDNFYRQRVVRKAH